MGGDASLGFRDLSLQAGDGFLRPAGRTGGLAHRKSGGFQRLQGVTVLPELNPVPGDVAVAVSDHGAAAAIATTGQETAARGDRRRLRTR